MRVTVKDIEGGQAATLQAGTRVYEMIQPLVARGEPVVLDFEGVWYTAPLFFHFCTGRLMDEFPHEVVARLVGYENLSEEGRSDLEWMVEKAIWRRDYPERAAAMERSIRRRSAEAWEE